MKQCNKCADKTGNFCVFHNKPIKEIETVLAGLDVSCKTIEFMDQ